MEDITATYFSIAAESLNSLKVCKKKLSITLGDNGFTIYESIYASLPSRPYGKCIYFS